MDRHRTDAPLRHLAPWIALLCLGALVTAPRDASARRYAVAIDDPRDDPDGTLHCFDEEQTCLRRCSPHDFACGEGCETRKAACIHEAHVAAGCPGRCIEEAAACGRACGYGPVTPCHGACRQRQNQCNDRCADASRRNRN